MAKCAILGLMQSRGVRCETLLHKLESSTQPLVMGILNATPDSFFASSRIDGNSFQNSLVRLCEEGADIIDIGGESTRPGSQYVSAEEELGRLLPIVEAAREHGSPVLSIDTRKASVARAALDAGADMVNDISACLDDPSMVDLLREYDCPVCIMHKQGDPASMQVNPVYGDLVSEVESFLLARAEVLQKAGIDRKKIFLDPGLGFGKTYGHNLLLIQNLPRLVSHGYPLVLGHSRKGFIGTALASITDSAPRPVEDRLFGSIAVGLIGAWLGARILRVHDVGPTKDSLKVLAAVREVHP